MARQDYDDRRFRNPETRMMEKVISYRACGVCDGFGDVAELIDSAGNLDILFGRPNGNRQTCSYCEGTGVEPHEVERCTTTCSPRHLP